MFTAYCTNKYSVPTTVPSGEFEILNPLVDGASSRSDANTAMHTRFLFEFDGLDMDEQKTLVRELLTNYHHLLTRVTFSGSKSLHCIVQFCDSDEETCRDYYKPIWHRLNRVFFRGKADRACANPARLTRRPGGIRSDTGLEQDLRFNDPSARFADSRLLRSVIVEEKLRARLRQSDIVPKYTHDGLCANYDKVTRYLNRDFPLLHGNGCSSSWLYAAVATCIKYGDNATLNRILDKARRERWTEKEIARILDSLRQK